MLTNKDLSAIQKLVKGEVQGTEERLNSKIEEVNSKIEEVEERLNVKISKVQESIDIVQAVVVKHHGKLEQRVASIEEELNISRN